MTDKEVLDYSKQIIEAKKEIENAETAAPDLEQQIKTKFAEDSANRSRFIDSILAIGGASKEFRNIFGIDAPHYELDNCYIAIDHNNNGAYEEDEKVTVVDSLNNNEKTKTFTDCWDMINAAKFDSDSTIPDYIGGSDKEPVERQRFFVDSKKGEKSSKAHSPICPPGYDRWAGNSIYKYICKNFDLTESTIYKILYDVSGNTIPKDVGIACKQSGVSSVTHNGFKYEIITDGDFDYNIDENGRITKNNFVYNYENDSDIFKAYRNDLKLPKEGCKPGDEHPVKWFETKVKVTSSRQNGKYYYTYNWTGTPFEKSKTPISSFEILASDASIINSGYSVFCLDPEQMIEITKPGSKNKTSDTIRFCVHIIYREGSEISSNVEAESWMEGSTVPIIKYLLNSIEGYYVKFHPITTISEQARASFADFVRNMEDDCLLYYNLAKERNIKLDIPDLDASIAKIEALSKAAKNYADFARTTAYTIRTQAQFIIKWAAFLIALNNRVIYTIFGELDDYSESASYSIGDIITHDSIPYYCIHSTTGTWDSSKWHQVFSSSPYTYNDTDIQFNGTTSYITGYDTKYATPSTYMSSDFRTFREPVYTELDNITITSVTVTKSIDNVVKFEEYPVGEVIYKGPYNKDISEEAGSLGTLLTRSELVNTVLTQNNRDSLTEKGLLRNDPSQQIKINGVWKDVDDTRIEVTYRSSIRNELPFNNIKRAQKLNHYLKTNPDLYNSAFITLSNRIDKRTGTLRKMCTLLESTNINSQMIEQRKKNIMNLFGYINAYEITGGFDSNVVTIKLSSWEPSISAYGNLERMGTVYLMSSDTKLDDNGELDSSTYVRTTITEVIDMISDTEYNYKVTEDKVTLSSIRNKANRGKYYVYDDQTDEYREAAGTDIHRKATIYERSTVKSGPVFNITLQDKLPEKFKGKNPMLIKVY